MLCIKKIALLVCVVMFSAAVQASTDWYYKAEVPVMSQSKELRVAAAKEGLFDVLTRLSGSSNVRQNTKVQKAAPQAIRYVQQFQYIRVSEPKLIQDGFSNILELSYSPTMLRRLLRDAGEPFWPVDRPTTLVWLVEDSAEEGKQVISVENGDIPLVSGLRKGAKQRGLPLSFPLLDFQDQTALSARQLWRLDEASILAASERYQANVVLVGKVTTTSSGQTWSNWQFFHAGRNRIYDFRADNAEDVGVSAMQSLADFLARRYAITLRSNDERALVMHVKNVRNFADYSGVMAVLRSKTAISNIALDLVQGDTLQLRISVDTDLKQLLRTLSLTDTLQRVPPEAGFERSRYGSDAYPIIYRWVN